MSRSGKETSAEPQGEGTCQRMWPAAIDSPRRAAQFPQNQDSTDPTLYAAIRRAQTLVSNVRGPPMDRPHPGQSSRRRS